MTTYTPDIRAKLEHYLETHRLPKGIGSKESACSIAAINLALTGKMTDDIPDCMSEVIGKATITLQDSMPDEMRNSARYKAWLPTAVGTGREREQERLKILMEWMWGTVLPHLQAFADEKGFGKEWQTMCDERTAGAAYAAAYATHAAAAADAAAYAAAYAAADAADAATHAAYAAAYATRAAADAADAAAAAAADAAAAATHAADAAADAAARDAADAARADFWEKVDPIGVLERMTNLEKTQ